MDSRDTPPAAEPQKSGLAKPDLAKSDAAKPDAAEFDRAKRDLIEPGLGRLAAAASKIKGPPPVHLWNPPFCGDIDMRIARDGTWSYNGSPIRRPELVRLFSTILRKDPERYVLVTPVERVGVQVEDAPFLAVEMRREESAEGPVLHFRTNVDDWSAVGPDHALRFEREATGGLKPYVHVRGDLWALVKRALLYDLAHLGEMRAVDGEEFFGVASGGRFFPMARAAEIEDALSG